MNRIWLTTVVVVSAGLSAGTTAGQDSKFTLESVSSLGKPENFKAGATARYAIWYEDGMWRVRTTSGAKGPHGFVGTIDIIGGKMAGLQTVGVEGKDAKKKEIDSGTWNAAGTQFKFTLKTGAGHTDGFDLKVTDRTTAIRFNLAVGGDEAPGKIFIGSTGAHPKSAVFYLPGKPSK